jgi:hypothetical protein
MIKVKATIRTLNLEKTLSEKREIYDTETANYLVASTKSFNNLMDDLKAENRLPSKVERTDLFLDKEETGKAIAGIVENLVKDVDYVSLVIEHIMTALDGACVFKKPPIVRKK